VIEGSAPLGKLEPAAALLRVLAAPVRLAVIVELGGGPKCVHELVAAIGASQSLVSQHLRVLRGAHLVATTRRGREITYRLTDDHVSHIVRDAIYHSQEEEP
jgi:DNA-binding transcriptional ArsR family regulator